MNSDHILETRKLTKDFKGFVAVNQVDLKVRRGTIHALIGPNGAGKTTCFNLLTKFLIAQRRTDPVQWHMTSPVRGAGAALHRMRHHPLVPDLCGLSASDCAARMCASALQREAGHVLSFLAERAPSFDQSQRARHAIAACEVDLAAYAPIRSLSSLPYGRKRALEIATTLAMEPELMLLDEPTQGMGHEDVHRVTAS